jgi:TolB protein
MANIKISLKLLLCAALFFISSPLQAWAVTATATPKAATTPVSDPSVQVNGSELFIDIGRAGARKFKLAVPMFGVDSGAAVSDVDRDAASEKMSDILSFVDAFEFVPAANFLAKGPVASRPIQYDDWTPLQIEGVIFGKFVPSSAGGKFSLEMRFFDVKGRKQLHGVRFSDFEITDLDRVLRRFADKCIEKLTGEKGIFSTRVAFAASRKAGEPRQIFISYPDGTGLRQITANGSINMSPSWSPDGTKLTYTSFLDGKADIFIFNLLTQKTTKLTAGFGNNSGANWHPDGRRIAFSGSHSGLTSIFTVNSLDGGDRKSFISGSGLEVEPAFSPDGSKVAFVSGRFGNPHLFIRDLRADNDTRITFAGWYNSSPVWRRDGRKLAFAGYDRDIDRYDIFIVNPDGRQMERLTLDQGDNEKPAWSPDGRFIVFQSNRMPKGRGKARNYKLYVMNRDGANVRPLALSLHDAVMPTWSPYLESVD